VVINSQSTISLRSLTIVSFLPDRQNRRKAHEKLNARVRPTTQLNAFILAFSPGSTLEPGLKAFRRRGPKWSL
jgi:hypothetical protein